MGRKIEVSWNAQCHCSHDSEVYDIVEDLGLDADASDKEIEDCARDIAFENIGWSWSPVDEDGN